VTAIGGSGLIGDLAEPVRFAGIDLDEEQVNRRLLNTAVGTGRVCAVNCAR